MDPTLTHVLAELERDTSIETAHGFAGLVAAYFAETRIGDGRGSTSRCPSGNHSNAGSPMRALEVKPPHSSGSLSPDR